MDDSCSIALAYRLCDLQSYHCVSDIEVSSRRFASHLYIYALIIGRSRTKNKDDCVVRDEDDPQFFPILKKICTVWKLMYFLLHVVDMYVPFQTSDLSTSSCLIIYESKLMRWFKFTDSMSNENKNRSHTSLGGTNDDACLSISGPSLHINLRWQLWFCPIPTVHEPLATEYRSGRLSFEVEAYPALPRKVFCFTQSEGQTMTIGCWYHLYIRQRTLELRWQKKYFSNFRGVQTYERAKVGIPIPFCGPYLLK